MSTQLRDAPAFQSPASPQRLACKACHSMNEPGLRFCGQCGEPLAPARARLPAAAEGGLLKRTGDGVSELVGLQRLQGFSMRELLSEVFKRRCVQELEDHLLAGTTRSTPLPVDAPSGWPKPWLFARMLFAALIVWVLLHIGWLLFHNRNLLPGMMVMGSFAVPAAVLVLFYEFNTPRNVSMLLATRMLIVGGALSLLVTLVLFSIGADLSSLIGASSAGFIEETAKLGAVVFAARRLSPVRYRYTLNGVVFGAAVGAGFAAFESAGYAFRILLQTGDASSMVDNILLRGILSPFAHVLWTAITAGALWRIKGARSFDSSMLASGAFVRLFGFSVGCHFLWNANVPFVPALLKMLLLGIVGWWVAFSLVQDGLRQLEAERQLALALRPGATA